MSLNDSNVPQKKWGSLFSFTIKTKILLILLGLLTFSLTTWGIIAFSNLKMIANFANKTNANLGKKVISNSSEALERFTEQRLWQMAKDQGTISNAILSQIQAETETIATFAEQIYKSPAEFHAIKSYSQNEKPANIYTASAYLIVKKANSDQIQNELNLLSALDHIFISLYNKDSNLHNLYIGTKSGIFKRYPWNVTSLDYDPRTRIWYQRAVKTGKAGWTDLYIDAAGAGLMISCFCPVRDASGKIVAVVGADVTLKTINESIINMKLGNDGYAFLIDQTGKLIARPGLTTQDKRWDESFETENLLQSNNHELVRVAKSMIQQKYGLERITYEDGLKYVAYAPIPITKWSVGLVLPTAEVSQTILLTNQKIMMLVYWASQDLTTEIKRIYLLLLCITLILSAIFIWVSIKLSKKITSPLLELNQGAQLIGKGQLDYKFNIHTGDEIEDLAETFNKMTLDLKHYIEALNAQTLAEEKINNELKIARDIQKSVLPKTFPNRDSIEFGVISVPAKIIGGDYYDFFELENGQIGILIADIVGKGIPAALYMVMVASIMYEYVKNFSSPKDAFTIINKVMINSPVLKKYVPVFYAVFDPNTLKFTYANAGHEPGLAWANGAFQFLDTDGFPLGGSDDTEFEEKTLQLRPGDKIMLFTDGITEARNTEETDFGIDRLKQLITQNSTLTAQSLTEKIYQSIEIYSQNTPQHDDLTMIILNIK